MKWGLALCFLVLSVKCFSQTNSVAGIIFDKDTKDRVAAVSIHNLNNNLIAYPNLKGEFKIAANIGDRLVFNKQDYYPDTIKVLDYTALAVYLARTGIKLQEVTIRDSALSPDKKFGALKQSYPQLYGTSANPDMLSFSPGSGAGIGIDAIYNAISRKGRNAEHLRETIQRDYEQETIDYRFNRTYVGMITGLKDDQLTNFMRRYRPGYFTTRTASEYEFVSMIKANLRRFLRGNRRTYTLPPLITPSGENAPAGK